MDPMIAIAIPGSILALGAVVFLSAKLTSWRFDHKHPGLSRQGRRALAEDRAARARQPAPFPPASWDQPRSMHAIDLEATAVEGALGRFGKIVNARRERNEEDAA